MAELPSFYPNLTGKVPPEVEQAIRYLFDAINQLKSDITALKK